MILLALLEGGVNVFIFYICDVIKYAVKAPDDCDVINQYYCLLHKQNNDLLPPPEEKFRRSYFLNAMIKLYKFVAI